ncbi:YhcN/YlaJ family sporulation lipoprotein [Bacillota bacterium LX-D]|nr:YhcN/YlaJ family sporulation lipoprotein [Bacillota bacterium LX-D]
MTKLRRISAIMLIFTFVLTVLLAGCGSPAQKPAPQPNDTQNRVYPQAQDNNKPNTVLPTDPAEANRIAKDLAKEATKVEGVKSATVVIFQDTVYCGIDLAANAEQSRTNEIKDMVQERLKRADKRVDNVAVTADADSVTRLDKIAKGISQGRPVSEFAKELGEIGRRITPSVK